MSLNLDRVRESAVKGTSRAKSALAARMHRCCACVVTRSLECRLSVVHLSNEEEQMRRMLVLSLALMALLGFVAPPDVFAQASAPVPKATITGFIDNVGTFAQNMSAFDFNLNRNQDKQTYGRTRGRFDIVGEIGQAKAVFGFEIDAYWGQTGFLDSNMGPGCATGGAAFSVQCGATGSGAESSFDINTDTQGSFQVKWLYAEFPIPLVPIPIIARLGAQPFATAASYKLATYANGDFPGINLYATISPTFKTQFTYVAIDENLTGKKDFPPFLTNGSTTSTGPFTFGNGKCVNNNNNPTAGGLPGNSTVGNASIPCVPQSRGDNWAIIASPEITVMKGLDIKPMLSTVFINGQTNSSTRQGRGGVVIGSGVSGNSGAVINSPFNPISTSNLCPTPANNANQCTNAINGADGAGTGNHEWRHTVGIDARWRSGPWSVDPSFYYQFGSQQKWLVGDNNTGGAVTSPYGPAGKKETADIKALLVDVRTSYQLGPLLLSHFVMATSGQDAKSNPWKSIRYFTPLDTDTGYLADWGTQIMSLGVDYYQILNGGGAEAGLNPGVAIGYDKYGRISTGVKASYA